MARRGRSRRRGGPGAGLPIAIGVALLMLVASVSGYFAYLKWTVAPRPKLDAETLCPIDGPRAITVVLVDASDDLPEIGRQQVIHYLTDVAETLPEFGRLELRSLVPGQAGGRIVFDKCNPGNGSDLSEWVANPEMARRKWLENFRKPLEDALASEFAPSAAETSPIMATIQHIAVERFEGRAGDAIPKNLIVVSDMIENTPAYSQYRGDLSYERFKKSPAYQQVRTDLDGATVTIEYVQRLKPAIDSVAHIAFWQQWVRDNRGELKAVDRLQGAN